MFREMEKSSDNSLYTLMVNYISKIMDNYMSNPTTWNTSR